MIFIVLKVIFFDDEKHVSVIKQLLIKLKELLSCPATGDTHPSIQADKINMNCFTKKADVTLENIKHIQLQLLKVTSSEIFVNKYIKCFVFTI